jgi:hypothetical protein
MYVPAVATAAKLVAELVNSRGHLGKPPTISLRPILASRKSRRRYIRRYIMNTRVACVMYEQKTGKNGSKFPHKI